MDGMTIQSKPNKADALQAIKSSILACCEADIREAFAPHGFTIEPLLIQLIREVHQLNEYFWTASTSAVRTPNDATGGDYPADERESGPEAPPASDERGPAGGAS